MLLRRLQKHLTSHDWFAVLIDVAVVIVSILIAFQIDRWAEGRRNQDLEREYLLRLGQDLQMEMTRIDASIQYANDRIDAARLLEQVARDPGFAVEVGQNLPWALETATWRSFPQITAFVYNELQATGNLSLLRDDSLRRGLAEHYRSLQHDRQVGTDLETQHRFEALTAGLLSSDELVAVELAAWDSSATEVSRERVLQIAAEFAANGAATALLPGLIQHHTFNIKVMQAARGRTMGLLERVAELLGSAPADLASAASG
jgi:hypothetical protein